MDRAAGRYQPAAPRKARAPRRRVYLHGSPGGIEQRSLARSTLSPTSRTARAPLVTTSLCVPGGVPSAQSHHRSFWSGWCSTKPPARTIAPRRFASRVSKARALGPATDPLREKRICAAARGAFHHKTILWDRWETLSACGRSHRELPPQSAFSTAVLPGLDAPDIPTARTYSPLQFRLLDVERRALLMKSFRPQLPCDFCVE